MGKRQDLTFARVTLAPDAIKNRRYVQGSVTWTSSPLAPKLGWEAKANLLEFGVKPRQPRGQ